MKHLVYRSWDTVQDPLTTQRHLIQGIVQDLPNPKENC